MPLACVGVKCCWHPVESNAPKKSPTTRAVRPRLCVMPSTLLKGLDCLKHESFQPKTAQAQFDRAKCEALQTLLHHSPPMFGKATSCWMLTLVTEVCFEQV